MELPKLLQGLQADPIALPSGGAAGGHQAQGKAVQLAKTVTNLESTAQKAYTEHQKIDHNFRLHPSLKGALEEAVVYMNRTLAHDGLEMVLSQTADEISDELQIVVKDQRQEGKIVKEYAPQDVLRYYAYSGYGTGLVVDGKI